MLGVMEHLETIPNGMTRMHLTANSSPPDKTLLDSFMPVTDSSVGETCLERQSDIVSEKTLQSSLLHAILNTRIHHSSSLSLCLLDPQGAAACQLL